MYLPIDYILLIYHGDLFNYEIMDMSVTQLFPQMTHVVMCMRLFYHMLTLVLFSKARFSMHECYCTKIPLSGVLLLQWFSWHCRHCMTLIKRPYYHVCSINQYACKTQAPLFSSHPCIYVRLWYCKRLLKFSWSLTVNCRFNWNQY